MVNDVVIVGCGVAGLFTALSLPKNFKITMLSKSKKENSNSYLAQGGLSVLHDPNDFNTYFEDTLKAGHYENSKEAVTLMLKESWSIVEDLLKYNVNFEQNNGKFLYTREGAHTTPRILFHEDITGEEITSKLLAEVELHKNITILEHHTMLDILIQENKCCGILCKNEKEETFPLISNYTIWATGGIGGLYTHSTNYEEITGDSLAIALKHNISLKDLNYVQIHPTTFYSKKSGRRFLITESVRGEGGLLYNKKMERFTKELLPRDILTQRIYEQMKEDNRDFVLLSFENISKETIFKHFPHIYHFTKEENFDITNEPIPVVPAQHYHMGGVAVNLQSETSLNRLYAVGETSCNGVHGANRLASNSLLESMVFAKQAAKNITNNYSPLNFTPNIQNINKISPIFSHKELIIEEIQKKEKKLIRSVG